MKKVITTAMKHPLISGSAILFGGGLITSFFNLLFKLFMIKNLTVVNFGILESLISIISLIMVIAGSALPMMVNFAASYFANNDERKLKGLYFTCTRYYFVGGFLLFFIFLFFPGYIAHFFKIKDVNLIIIVGVSLFFVFISTVNAAFLQAKLAFMYSSVINLIGSIGKYLLGMLLVFSGLGIVGALFGYISSFIVVYLLGFFPLLFFLKNKEASIKVSKKEMFFYGAPSALTMFGLTSFVTIDIILVKHFFTPEQAGLYAGLSLIGRIIFFFSAPIGSVMFPLVTQKHAKKESYHHEFILSLILVLIPSVLLTVFYFLFPTIAINFFKKEYLPVANLLGIFGIYITMYSLLTIFINFYLSIKKTKIYLPVIFGLLLQIGLLWFFHRSFLEVIFISGSIVGLLLFGCTIYYIQNERKL